MFMKYLSVSLALILAALSFLSSPASAQQTLQDSALIAVSRSLQSGEKALPRANRATVDVVGKVVDSEVLSDTFCNTGSRVTVLFVQVGKSLVSTVCGTADCASVRVGQRARFQGTLVTAPDPLDPAFEPCDTDTWVPGPLNVFVATKVSR
jgi:hypothetical protein